MEEQLRHTHMDGILAIADRFFDNKENAARPGVKALKEALHGPAEMPVDFETLCEHYTAMFVLMVRLMRHHPPLMNKLVITALSGDDDD